VFPKATQLKRLRVWIGLIFLLAGISALGSTNSDWFTRAWQIDDGLLDNDINGIVQGPDGYLWLLTPAGLMRFDGVTFSPFAIEDFSGPSIRFLLCSRTGVVWLASDGGKIIGLNSDFSTVSLANKSLPERMPIALASDDKGVLWLGYHDVICRVQDGQVEKFGAKDGVPPGTFHSLNSDGDGNIWLAKGNQISSFRNSKFQPIASLEGVQYIAGARANGVWAVSATDLFFCATNGLLRDCGSFQKSSNVKTASLIEDRAGSVWIGTDRNGLFHYHQSRFERIETSHSSILCLAQDREGNIWAGTGGGGLDRITRSGIRLESPGNNQVQSQMQSICQDASGGLWGATQNGTLMKRIGGQWEPVFTNAPLAGTVMCVAADQNAVWAGTRTGKLLRIVNTNCTISETHFANVFIYGLLAASNGDLWIVGGDVLQRLHKQQITTIKLPSQVQRVYAIAEDAAGNIWIGANNSLLRFDGTNIVDETLHSHLFGRPFCCIYGTADGSVWIGSRGGGLIRIKNGQVGQIGLNQGLMNDTISQIVADQHGWFWFGSKRGIFKLRHRDIELAMENRNISLRPIIYGKNEGLISQEAVFSIATPFVLPHALLSRDRRVWMLMHAGIVVADPDILSENISAPTILLSQVSMDGQVIASHEGLTSATQKNLNSALEIPSSHRHLEFDFTAFNFRAPENLRFRYQLVGYDNGWIDAGTQRSADYSRLAAGDYQFRVEASVGDNPWSDTPATLDFKVSPFFWQTWWFRFVVVLAFTLSLIAIVRYVSYRRLRSKLSAIEQQAAIERERQRIARDIHDDLGNRLTEIQLLTGLAQRNQETFKAGLHIHEISSAARQATDALDEIVWAINPRNDTLPHLINYLGQFATDYLRTAGILCRLDLPENPPAKSVSAEVRHNLFLAIKESLNNIARHANATEVSVRILATDNSLSVIIEDNGQGFNEAIKSSGADGLENMSRRIAEIGGQFKIKSQSGVGTSISFDGLWLAEK
jgi:signal transduction histidine kinase/ligand-binding sensor domain-containing protein